MVVSSIFSLAAISMKYVWFTCCSEQTSSLPPSGMGKGSCLVTWAFRGYLRHLTTPYPVRNPYASIKFLVPPPILSIAMCQLVSYLFLGQALRFWLYPFFHFRFLFFHLPKFLIALPSPILFILLSVYLFNLSNFGLMVFKKVEVKTYVQFPKITCPMCFS